MPRFRAPQQSRGRLQASFGKTAKRSTEQKNGRKGDLATALLPKGDTRATNAKIEYHVRGDCASDFFCCAGRGTGERRIVTPTGPGHAGRSRLGRLVLQATHDP